jgi:hypothetical protein
MARAKAGVSVKLGVRVAWHLDPEALLLDLVRVRVRARARGGARARARARA